jgi:predicted phage tail protein
MREFLLIFSVMLFCAFNICAQNGGKAEPVRLKIPQGQTNMSLIGNLKENQQAEYIFNAKKGQLISVWMNSVKPQGKFYSFVVKGAANNFASKIARFDIEKFETSEAGDYLIFIKFRPMGKIKQGSYRLSLDIKN